MSVPPIESDPTGPDRRRLVVISFVVLTLAHIIAVLCAWWGIPLQTDTGMWAYIGERMLEGARPYRDLWDQKPPGIFFIFAALQWTFGAGDDRVFHGLDAILTAMICLGTFFLARRLCRSGDVIQLAANENDAADGAVRSATSLPNSRCRPNPMDAAVAASAAVLLLSIVLGHRVLADWGCNVEKFVALFEVAAVWLLSGGRVYGLLHHEGDGIDRTPSNASAFLAGLCCGMAGMFKQTAVLLPIIITTLAWVRRAARSPRASTDAVAGRVAADGMAAISLRHFWIGIVAPWIPVFIWMLSAGIVEPFWRDVVAYDLMRIGGPTAERSSLIRSAHWEAVWNTLILAAVLLAPAFIELFTRRSSRGNHTAVDATNVSATQCESHESGCNTAAAASLSSQWHDLRIVVVLQFLLTLLVLIVAPHGYGHYLLQTAPFAAILAAMLFTRIRRRSISRGRFVFTFIALIAGAAMLRDHLLFTLDRDYVYRTAYQEVSDRRRALAEFLRRSTKSPDAVMIWPPDPAVSWYAGRPTPLESTNLPIVFGEKIAGLTPPMPQVLSHLQLQPPTLVIDRTPLRITTSAENATDHPSIQILAPRDGSSLLEEPDDRHPDGLGRALAPMKRWLRANYGGQTREKGFTVYRRHAPWRTWEEYLLQESTP